MRNGLKSYFTKYAYSNTVYEDFLVELGNAAHDLKIEEDLVEWAHTWLQTAGVNVIHCTYDEDG